jgi:hypothetical protein
VEHDVLKGQAIEVLAGSASHAAASLQDHGTAVAAILVGRPESQTPGLLPGAKIIAVDAFYRDSGAADRTDVMSLVAAMEKARRSQRTGHEPQPVRSSERGSPEGH